MDSNNTGDNEDTGVVTLGTVKSPQGSVVRERMQFPLSGSFWGSRRGHEVALRTVQGVRFP